MTEQESESTTSEVSDTVIDPDSSLDLDGVSEDEMAEIMESVRVSGPEGKMSLKAATLDLLVAHKEIEDYKKGAFSLYQALDERQAEAEAQGQEAVAEVIEEVKKSAFGVYARVHRGDAEVLGDRDGKYAGYFESDQSPDEFEVEHDTAD